MSVEERASQRVAQENANAAKERDEQNRILKDIQKTIQKKRRDEQKTIQTKRRNEQNESIIAANRAKATNAEDKARVLTAATTSPLLPTDSLEPSSLKQLLWNDGTKNETNQIKTTVLRNSIETAYSPPIESNHMSDHIQQNVDLFFKPEHDTNPVSVEHHVLDDYLDPIQESNSPVPVPRESTKEQVAISTLYRENHHENDHHRLSKSPMASDREANKSTPLSSKEKNKTNHSNFFKDWTDDLMQDNDNTVFRPTDTTSIDSPESAHENRANDPQYHQNIREFVITLSKNIVSQAPQLSAIEKKRDALKDSGLSDSDIDQIEQDVLLVANTTLVDYLKKSTLAYHMSRPFSKSERIATHEHQKEALEIESDRHSQSNASSKSQRDAMAELHQFLFDESTSSFVRYELGLASRSEFTRHIMNLKKMARSAGIPFSEKDLQSRMVYAFINLGITPFKQSSSTPSSFLETFDAPHLSNQKKILNMLWDAYMTKAMNPNNPLFDRLIRLKMTIKNGLTKLGLYKEDIDLTEPNDKDRMEIEQIMDKLYANAVEEATLEKKQGVEYDILRRKEAAYRSRAEKIGFPITDDTLDTLKEKAYNNIYTLLKEEIMQLETIISSNPDQQFRKLRPLNNMKNTVFRISSEYQLYDAEDTVANLIKPLTLSSVRVGA